MLDFAISNQSSIEVSPDPQAPRPTGRSWLASHLILRVRKIAALMPRTWIPFALRGLFGMSSRLPPELRQKVLRLIGLMGSDMGSIERDYPRWIVRNEHVDAKTRRCIAASIDRMTDPPLISVLMPVFNPAPGHLLSAIHSVQGQFYPWWELCIADDASTDPEVSKILSEAAGSDQRIKLMRRKRNGHISAASNSSLDLATGQFVALLDHDDMLAPDALYEVAARIAAQPDVDIIYSDEDHIDDEGHRAHPYFKPAWSPELLLGQNLISHLGVYRRELVKRIGGFRLGLEGSQDHDLALRAVAQTTAARVVHIPKVLYHWRQGAADPTFSQAAHDRCVRSSRLAIADFIAGERPGASVAEAAFIPNWTRVIHPVPAPAPLVSIVVVSQSADDEMDRCVGRLLRNTDYAAVEILIFGSPSTRPAVRSEVLAIDERVRILEEQPRTLSNAVRSAHGRLILLLDADLQPCHPGWLREMVSQAIRPDIGAVGAKLLGPEGTVRHAGFVIGGEDVVFHPFIGRHRSHAGYFGHLQLTRDVTAVSSGCMMLRRQDFLDVGGFDEVLASSVLGDVDLCLKLIRTGLRNLWTPYAELSYRHDPALTQGPSRALSAQAKLRMRTRWGRRLEDDPYWNPNLGFDPHELALNLSIRTASPTSLQAA